MTLEDSALNRLLEELRSLYFELDRRVDSLTAELRQMAHSSDYAQQVELLSTVPGIGWLTALARKLCHRLLAIAHSVTLPP